LKILADTKKKTEGLHSVQPGKKKKYIINFTL